MTMLVTAPAVAQEQQERVHFADGARAATVSGSVTGFDTKQYVLGAKAGQILSIEFRPSRSVLYYDVLKDGETLRDGSVEGDSPWSKKLPADGDYVIDLHLLRSEAGNGTKASYKLKIAVAAGGEPTTTGH